MNDFLQGGGGEGRVGEIERLLLSMGTWSLPSLPFQLPTPKVLDTRQVRLSPSLKSFGPGEKERARLSALLGG